MDKSGAPREPKITDSTIARARDHRLVFHIMGLPRYPFHVGTMISIGCFVFKRTTKFYQRLARLNFQKITSQQTCSFLLQHQPHQHTDTQLSTISTTTRVQYCK
ncbi:uncharacterized protein LOC123215985 isoform X3 [Mangifera indica]|uniref:uncharacterized protein LOC123215985 isoform X3 n=1 Tax=Mangifera indica TaxID=29780 RepID=UPI001CFA8278|nr:uncharacterized protein LOC123215985 isoform X3 [Mangifera indica]